MTWRILNEMGVPLTVVLLMWIYSFDRCANCMLQLSSYPELASSGMSYTMSCSSNSTGDRARRWYKDGDIILRTRYESLTQCLTDVADDNLYRRLSGRIDVSCSNNLHNLTLLVSASDNGSTWWCRDDVAGWMSNTLTIIVTETSVTSPPPPPPPTTPPTPPQSTPDGGSRNSNVLWRGIGIGSGITILMFGICLGIAVVSRKRAIVLQVQASEVQQGIAVPVPEGEGYLTPRATSDNTSGTDELHLEETQQNNYTELEGSRDGAFNQYEQMRIYHEI